MESLFNTRQDYSLQPRTLLSSVTDDLMKLFWNSCAKKLWKIVRKTYVVEFFFNRVAQIQSTTIYRTTLLIYTFWKCSERKECSKILKLQKKTLRNCLFFSNATTLQPNGVVLVSLLLLWTYLTACSSVSIVNFEHVYADWEFSLSTKFFLWVFWNSWKFAGVWYVPKSSFSRNFEKSPFNRSSRLIVYSLQRY